MSNLPTFIKLSGRLYAKPFGEWSTGWSWAPHPLSRHPVQNKLEGVLAWQAPKCADGSQMEWVSSVLAGRVSFTTGFPSPPNLSLMCQWALGIWCLLNWEMRLCLWTFSCGPGSKCLLACHRDLGSVGCEGRCSDALSYFYPKPPVEEVDTSVCTHVHTPPLLACIHISTYAFLTYTHIY